LSARRIRFACACLAWAAGAVDICRAAETPQTANARAAIVGAIQERLGPNLRVDLETLVCRLAPDAPETLTATPDPTGRTGRPVRFTFAAATGPRGHAVRVGEATAVVHVSGPHVRAARAIDAGRTLTQEDIALGDGPIEGAPLRRLSTPIDVIGARTLRALAAGDPVVDGVVAVIPVIRAGERVRATFRSVGFEAAVVAVAEQSGQPGQLIRVVNPDTRRVIRARVVAKGEVEVFNGW